MNRLKNATRHVDITRTEPTHPTFLLFLALWNIITSARTTFSILSIGIVGIVATTVLAFLERPIIRISSVSLILILVALGLSLFQDGWREYSRACRSKDD